MRFLVWNLLLCTWLLISAFVLPHTPLSAAHAAVTAFLVALFAFLAAGKPASRFVITVLGAILGASALLLFGVSLATAVNNAIVGALLFTLSLVRPTHAVATTEGAVTEPPATGPPVTEPPVTAPAKT